MSSELFPVPADWAEKAWCDNEKYLEMYERSVKDPEGFWLEAATEIDWEVAPTRALDDSAAPFYRWYPDGRLNTCYNALDRHVEGPGDPQLVGFLLAHCYFLFCCLRYESGWSRLVCQNL